MHSEVAGLMEFPTFEGDTLIIKKLDPRAIRRGQHNHFLGAP